LKRALPGVAETFPDSSSPLVVQTFTDYKHSREGFGDVLMVPKKPVTLDPEGIAQRRPLLAVIDPSLEPAAVAAAASPAPSSIPAESSSPDAGSPPAVPADAAPGAQPAPARPSHGCEIGGGAEGGTGGLLLAGILAALGLRRRGMRTSLAAVLAIGMAGCK